MTELPTDIRSMSVADRVALATAIWDSVEEDTLDSLLSDAQRAEISRRLQSQHANPEQGDTWDAVKKRLLEG